MSRISSLARNILKYNLDFVFLDEEELDDVLAKKYQPDHPQIIATAVNHEARIVVCCLADGAMIEIDMDVCQASKECGMPFDFNKTRPVDSGYGVKFGFDGRSANFIVKHGRVLRDNDI